MYEFASPYKDTQILAYLDYRDLNADVAAARKKAVEIEYSEMVKIGRIEDYEPSSLRFIDAKVVVSNRCLYLIECNTGIHEVVSYRIGSDLVSKLNSNRAKGRGIEFQGLGNPTFPDYVNLMECTTSGIGKAPDGSVSISPPRNRRRISPWIVLEVAFRNESYRRLLIEGACWTNRYSDTEFCILLWIKENAQQTDVEYMQLLVFRRLFPFRSDLEEIPNPECVTWEPSKALDIPTEDLARQLQVSILHRQDVSRATLANRERVILKLPTDRADGYFGRDGVFREGEVLIDLTSTFERLFAEVNTRVDLKTYPY